MQRHIFIPKHYNAFKGIWGSANGIETIIHQNCSADTNRLAQHVQDELVRAHGRVNRGVKTDMQQSGINIALLCNTNMPAILTESGFMDNLAESKNHAGFQEKLNKAVPDCQYVPLKVDGIYSPKVRIAVLMFGNQRDGSRMGKIPDGKDTGWIVGSGTRVALA